MRRMGEVVYRREFITPSVHHCVNRLRHLDLLKPHFLKRVIVRCMSVTLFVGLVCLVRVFVI